jgi:hypothetical protein
MKATDFAADAAQNYNKVPGVRCQVSGVRIEHLNCLTPHMKLHEIQCHFHEVPHSVTEYKLRYRPRPYKILIYEDKDEKNQIRSHAFALRLFLFSAFPIFSRGIVPPYRTTTGPTSEFLTPDT